MDQRGNVVRPRNNCHTPADTGGVSMQLRLVESPTRDAAPPPDGRKATTGRPRAKGAAAGPRARASQRAARAKGTVTGRAGAGRRSPAAGAGPSTGPTGSSTPGPAGSVGPASPPPRPRSSRPPAPSPARPSRRPAEPPDSEVRPPGRARGQVVGAASGRRGGRRHRRGRRRRRGASSSSVAVGKGGMKIPDWTSARSCASRAVERVARAVGEVDVAVTDDRVREVDLRPARDRRAVERAGRRDEPDRRVDTADAQSPAEQAHRARCTGPASAARCRTSP